ncbi:UNVERIFIED_ORG: hypothetical protein GGD58_002698 [Rhizobium pisi]
MSLESRDVVSRWYSRLHQRDLNARRAKEITAAAKQAREFFRSASESAYAVRPLLTFYGVASLSRALTLLCRREGGEEGLTRGYGLETVQWPDTLSGELAHAIANIGNLKVRTTRGLFQDLVTETNNRLPIHATSQAVDWGLDYDPVPTGQEVSLSELLDRLPDVVDQHQHLQRSVLYARVGEIKFNHAAGLSLRTSSQKLGPFKSEFIEAGFSIAESGQSAILTCDAALFDNYRPQFLHSYVHKAFGSIPQLYLVSQLAPNIRYSQIALTYVIGFLLGMLARYFPTHWTALMSGEKGDTLWPSINAAHHYVETVFPELVLELIEDSLARAERTTQ